MALTLVAQVFAGIPFWGSDSLVEEDIGSTNPWDTVYFAGKTVPGICDVKPTGIASIEIDKKKVPGGHGSTITILGYEPRTFDITCEIWTADQWRDLQSVVAQFWRGPKAKRSDEVAIAVRHPALQALKISSAIIIGVSPPVRGTFEGSRIVTFHMHEQVKRGKTNVTQTTVDVVQGLKNNQEAHNSAETSPGADANYTSPFPKSDPLAGSAS